MNIINQNKVKIEVMEYLLIMINRPIQKQGGLFGMGTKYVVYKIETRMES